MSLLPTPGHGVRLRPGTASDIPALWALRTRCVRQLCSAHYPAEVIARWSASPAPAQYPRLLAQGGCVVAEDAAGTLLGFALLDREGNEVDALFVEPQRGGQGIGHVLMQQMLAMADPSRPVILSSSLNAVPFYQRHGFIAGRERAYPHPCGVALASVPMYRPWP